MAGRIPKAALNVTADAPDLRDRYYEPTLAPLHDVMHPPGNLYVLDQGKEGACTGFGLAATINLLYRFQNKEHRVSPWMLYALAQRYDEWPGEDYDGSSCRGAIKGWKNTGVCLEALAQKKEARGRFVITPEISSDARNRTIGAYYRIRPNITDFHAALNEAGVIYASASVHEGWYQTKEDKDGEAYIPQHDTRIGGHAFAIVGYNQKGFWIQNSWGEDKWGQGGLALWLYEDWAKNVMDAWVVQLALPTPQVFSASSTVGSDSPANLGGASKTIPRQQIEEHFAHLDDGKYHDSGRYWSNPDHMNLIQERLKTRKYNHLLLYAHGGLNSIKDSAKRIAAMKEVYLANGIYPLHFMYDTGLGEELKDIILNKRGSAENLAGGIRDWFDRRIENITRKPGRALWREMKFGAEKPFETRNSDGTDVLNRIIGTVRSLSRPIKIHAVGHSTGAILHAFSLTRAASLFNKLTVSTCSLLAPATSNRLFNQAYLPLLKNKVIKDLTIYNLTDKVEEDDNVAYVYGKSLLYLVARAFEDDPVEPIVGMQKFNGELKLGNLPANFVYSRGSGGSRTASESHGGFDNDPATLNDVLKRILGKKPDRPFTKEDLEY
jgi:hypothetical protein